MPLNRFAVTWGLSVLTIDTFDAEPLTVSKEIAITEKCLGILFLRMNVRSLGSIVAVTVLNFGIAVNQSHANSIPTAAADSIRPYCTPLSHAIDSVLDRHEQGRKHWGILVEALPQSSRDPSRILYSHNSEQYFIPASNIKLLTTAAALQNWSPSAYIGTRPLNHWVETVNLYSHNGSADSLLRNLGGSQVAQQRLAQIGVNPLHYRLVDGSGLSRYNMAKPTTFIHTLKAMRNTTHWPTFYESLPVAGVKGTLRHRLTEPEVRTKVRAKTGTLWGVRALSGYMDHADYGPVVFSILANNPKASGYHLVSIIDEIVLSLARDRPC